MNMQIEPRNRVAHLLTKDRETMQTIHGGKGTKYESTEIDIAAQPT